MNDNNKENKHDDNPWKFIILAVVANYLLAGFLYLFTETTEGGNWIRVLWPFIALCLYGMFAYYRYIGEQPIPVVIKNETNISSSNHTNENSDKQKIIELKLQLNAKNELIAHMQEEINSYKKQIDDLIKKI